VDRAGLRRKLLKAQAEAGDIVLLFADESEALTHPYLAHVWAQKGADLRVPAPGQSTKVAMLGVLDWARRKLIVRTSRTKRSADFIALLEEVDRRYGPKLGWCLSPSCSSSTTVRSTPAKQAARRSPCGLIGSRSSGCRHTPQRSTAPALNDIEAVWRDLKRHHLAHQTFTGPQDLDCAIHKAVIDLNTERNRHPWANQRIAA
jgi:hypothetical protein